MSNSLYMGIAQIPPTSIQRGNLILLRFANADVHFRLLHCRKEFSPHTSDVPTSPTGRKRLLFLHIRVTMNDFTVYDTENVRTF